MRYRMGILRNIQTIFIVSLFFLESFFILISTPAYASIAVSPPDATITMNDVFPEKEIKLNVNVENQNRYDTNVSARIENQLPYLLKENYTDMPSLSWVKITPNIVHLSGKQSKLLEVTIYIPDEEKPLQYNKRWEFVVVLSEIKDEPANTVNIVTEVAIPVRIKTPESAKMQIPYNQIMVIFFIVMVFVALIIFMFYAKKKKRVISKEKPTVFYFKKRKLKNK
jgi:hypothetical protein